MIAGLTGTEKGMTTYQFTSLRSQVEAVHSIVPIVQWHHGDCVGSDSQSHDLATYLKIPVYVHPGDNNSKRAFCQGFKIFDPLPNLERNIVIAATVEILFATPKEFREVLRSGTWHTIRRARKFGKKIIIIFPDGSLSRENFPAS